MAAHTRQIAPLIWLAVALLSVGVIATFFVKACRHVGQHPSRTLRGLESNSLSEVRSVQNHLLNTDRTRLVEFATQGSANERRAAIEALGWTQDSSYLPLFLSALEDKERRVRISAAFALGWMPSTPELCQKLLELRASEPDETVVLMIEEAIWRLKCPQVRGEVEEEEKR